jgi:uncharacterized alkaline shock family protein YloU
MNTFNRIVIILLLLAMMILIPLALILPEQTEYVLRYLADLIQVNLLWLSSLSGGIQIAIRLALAAIALIVFVIGLLFLVLEIVRLRRRTVRLRDGSGELMMEGLSGHLAYHIDQLPNVLRVRPDIESKGKSVRAALYVETGPDVSVPEKSAEIREVARKVIEEQLGLEIKGDIKVMIKPLSYPKVGHSGRQTEIRQPVPRPVASREERTTQARLEDFVPPPQTPPAQPEGQVVEVKGPTSQDTGS